MALRADKMPRMATVEPVDVVLIVYSDTNGVFSVEVYDFGNNSLHLNERVGCESSYTISFPGLRRNQFPLRIEANECRDRGQGLPAGERQPIDLYNPFPGTPAATPPCGTIQRQEMGVPPQCIDARNRASDLANQIRQSCFQISSTRSRIETIRAAATALYITGALLTIAAGIAGAVPFAQPGAVILTALAAMVFIAAILQTSRQRQAERTLSTLESQHRTLSEQFNAAAQEVGRACCPEEFSPQHVTLPMCT